MESLVTCGCIGERMDSLLYGDPASCMLALLRCVAIIYRVRLTSFSLSRCGQHMTEDLPASGPPAYPDLNPSLPTH